MPMKLPVAVPTVLAVRVRLPLLVPTLDPLLQTMFLRVDAFSALEPAKLVDRGVC
jgi:hypothetical protein